MRERDDDEQESPRRRSRQGRARGAPDDMTTHAVVTFVLYWFAYLPGLVANLVFLGKARDIKRRTRVAPSGMGCLVLQLWVFLMVPLVGIGVLIAMFGAAAAGRPPAQTPSAEPAPGSTSSPRSGALKPQATPEEAPEEVGARARAKPRTREPVGPGSTSRANATPAAAGARAPSTSATRVTRLPPLSHRG